MDKFIALANKYLTGNDFVATAKKLLAALHVPKPAIAILLPVIANAIRLVVRNDTREGEYVAFAGTGLTTSTATPATATQWSDFLRDKFALGDGRWVSWGEATVAEHGERIEYLGAKRDGIEQTMSRHQLAIERITSAGVSCLNELQEPKTKSSRKTTGQSPQRSTQRTSAGVSEASL